MEEIQGKKHIIIILEYMEYGLGKTPHSVTLTKWRLFFGFPILNM